MRPLFLLFLVLVLVSSCSPAQPRDEAASSIPASSVGTLTPLPTATFPPTVVPGTSADMREVKAVVEEFGEALVRNDEIVALLVLSPSAQKVVAASSLNVFLGRPEQPKQVMIRAVHLDDDVAVADLTVQYVEAELPVRLRLVRLDNQWRIDGRTGD
ncbi:MAG: hypothetical protein M3R24_12365 [Chloroflexota bacterium]|nr:hypothetical protein [Chloroflexota bacterium]